VDVAVGRTTCYATQENLHYIEGIARSEKSSHIVQAADVVQNQVDIKFILMLKGVDINAIEFVEFEFLIFQGDYF
jgi:hypothetical protein